jgi:transcriptional regulator with XRE-family HTH domain
VYSLQVQGKTGYTNKVRQTLANFRELHGDDAAGTGTRYVPPLSERLSCHAGICGPNGDLMVAESDQSPLHAKELADRLRDLRESHGLTQKQLATVLSTKKQVGVTTISAWENPSPDQLPPLDRLKVYARLFCTDRSFASASPRLLRDDELTEDERQQESALNMELRALREKVQSPASGPTTNKRTSLIWKFPDENPISIVCSGVRLEDQPPYANSSHLNYTPYANFADLNSLIDVYGEVKANNPSSEVKLLLPYNPSSEVKPPLPKVLDHESSLNHLVFIGGAAVARAEGDQEGRDRSAVKSEVERVAPNIPLPAVHESGDTHIFTYKVEGEIREFTSTRDDDGNLTHDVGFIARGPHINNPGRTVTMISGITSRGVHGAALCFIHRDLREKNEEYFKDYFGNTNAFCILMRVPVRDGMALPPNLLERTNRLYEWTPETGAHW